MGGNAAGSGTAPFLQGLAIMDSANEKDEWICGFAIKFTGLQGNYTQAGSNFGFFGFGSDAGATNHYNWIPTTSGQIQIRRGGTAFTTINSAYFVNQWHYIEQRVKLHDTLGSIIFKIDGVERYSASGIDTKNAGTKAVFDCLQVGLTNGSGSWIIDDLYLLDVSGSVNNNFLGDLAIETLYPNANGDTNQWVGSDGNSVDNYLNVDEAVPSATDYNQGSAIGDKDLYGIQDLSRPTGVVHGALVTSYMVNTDSGPRGANTIVKSGATTTTPADKALSSSAKLYDLPLDVDPNTGVKFTVAGINALQIGAQVTS
jgi:hypothetical protein